MLYLQKINNNKISSETMDMICMYIFRVFLVCDLDLQVEIVRCQLFHIEGKLDKCHLLDISERPFAQNHSNKLFISTFALWNKVETFASLITISPQMTIFEHVWILRYH